GAEAALREAVRLRPESAATHTNLANVLVARGNLAEARNHFESAVRIGPSLEPARSARAAALAVTGGIVKAQEQYDAAIRRQRSDAQNTLGTALAAEGRIQQALEHYRLATAHAPAAYTGHLNLGMTHANQ